MSSIGIGLPDGTSEMLEARASVSLNVPPRFWQNMHAVARQQPAASRAAPERQELLDRISPAAGPTQISPETCGHTRRPT